jgi:catechol 2,3-dioxygenase-like lactoylglutathione lyase family enzyme
MALTGCHTVLYTSEPEALRAMLRDVFGFKYVDAGGGWVDLCSAAGRTRSASGRRSNWESGMRHEIAFMCDNIAETVSELRGKGVQIEGEPQFQSYGLTIKMTLPGGLRMLLYEPRHATAIRS